MIWLVIILIIIQTALINYLGKRFKFKKFWIFYLTLLIIFLISYYLINPVINYDITNGLIGGLIGVIFITLPMTWWEGIKGKNKFSLSNLLQDFLVVAPLEELVFRGLLLTILLPYGLINAVLMSSIVFSAWHWSKDKHLIITTFWIGIIFSIMYLLFNSILAPIIVHATLNQMNNLIKPLIRKIKKVDKII